MNRSFTEDQSFDSVFGIYEKFYGESVPAKRSGKELSAVLLARLSVLWAFLCSAAAIRLARVVGFTLSLIGTVGIVGAMERGRLSLGLGLLLAGLLFGIEYLCLRTRKK